MLRNLLTLAATCAAASAVSMRGTPQVNFPPSHSPEEFMNTIRAAMKTANPMDAFNGMLAGKIAERRRSHEQKLAAGDYITTSANTPYGQLNGFTDPTSNVTQFFGVPFAQPPIDGLRWTPAQPPSNWGIRNATSYAPVCMQDSESSPFAIFNVQSEDCLYLNIYMPSMINRTPPAGGWPIMVFFYGGSFETGAGSFWLYDALQDIAITEDCIIITPNYRINVYGFLASSALKSTSADGSYGNYGLTDQRQALKFVKLIASSINGNPNSITIFGESAGGGSVSNHLASPKSWGLFQRAIIESGFGDWVAMPSDMALAKGDDLTVLVGCNNTDPQVEVDCMRQVSTAVFMTADRSLPHHILVWAPVIDGVDVIAHPKVQFENGFIAPGVAVMLGTNANEGSLFIHAPYDLNATDYEQYVALMIGSNLAPTVVQEYPPTIAQDPFWSLSRVITDSCMSCPARAAARWMTSSNRQGGPQSTYLYHYTHVLWVVEYIANYFRPLGCFHASELAMVFQFDLMLWGPGEKDLAKMFVRYWTRFAITGNPNGNNPASGLPDPTWTSYNITTDLAGVIDIDSNNNPSLVMTANLKKPYCDFWDQIVIPPTVIF